MESLYKPDRLPRIDIELAEKIVRNARQFKEQNTDFFKAAPSLGIVNQRTKYLGRQCKNLLYELNMSAKSLIAQGGEVKLLDEIPKLIEDFNLVLGKSREDENPLWTKYVPLGSGDLNGYKPYGEEAGIQLYGWSAMRTETRANFIDAKNFDEEKHDTFDSLPKKIETALANSNEHIVWQYLSRLRQFTPIGEARKNRQNAAFPAR